MAHPNIKLGAEGRRVKPLQTGVDRVVAARGFKWRKVPIDGVAGQATFKAAHFALWLMGASEDQLRKVRKNHVITDHAYQILTGKRERSQAMKRRDLQRRDEAKKLRLAHKRNQEIDEDGWSTWDGFRVAAWMVGRAKGPDGTITNWLQKSKDKGWSGHLYSGGRTPEYSEQLCYNICGAPSCSGLCAGRSSNHSGNDGSYPGWGAIDVQDYYNFARIQKEIGSPLWNNLPNDRPHFSTTGN